MAGMAANVRRHPRIRPPGDLEAPKKMRIPIENSTSYQGRNSRPNLPALLLFVVLALGAGAVAATFSPFRSAAAAQWYAMLAKPDWLPPRAWFAPIWVALYVLMGVAAWVVW